MPDLDLDKVHPAERLTLPTGGQADIDLEMIPLVQALWAAGLSTAACCQDLGESIAHGAEWARGEGRLRHAGYYQGQAWLKMPTDDALSMLASLAEHPLYKERLTRWTSPDAWESYVYLTPSAQGAALTPWAQIHFPRQQIIEVTALLGKRTAVST